MKYEKTDSEIFAWIKQSLDSYQEGYVPGSWENYQQRGKAKKRKLFLQIASGIAACLLIGFAGTELIHFEKTDSLKLSASQTPGGASQQTSEPVVINQSAISSPLISSSASAVSSPDIKPSASPMIAVAASHKTIRLTGAALKAAPESRSNSLTAKENATSVPQSVTNIAADSVKKVAALAENTAVAVGKNKHDSLRNGQDTIRVAAKFQDTQPKTQNQEIAETHKRKVRFGINFSPGVSTAKSSNSFNFTGGLSADISLFSNFQLTTGLQVENQNVVQKIPGMASSTSASSSAAPSSAIPITTAPLNEYSTKMINLDVPINITWKFFSEKKNSYYVSAGLSSLVYLHQNNKNTTYSQDLIPVSSIVGGTEVKSYNVVDQVSVSENTVAPNQTFDFAGRVNIMVGFEKKLSNKLYIHIEPYAKIPASGLAPGNLNHTSTGINFKISF